VDNGDASKPPEQQAAQESNDPVEFEVFYRTYYRELVKAAMYAGATLHDAQEAVDASMEEIHGRWTNIQHPRAYAHQAVRSNLKKLKGRGLDRIRRRQIECGEGVWEEGKDARLTVWEDTQWVRQLLESLPPSQREAMAFVVDGLKPGEVADVLGITPEAARNRLFAARARLKVALRDQRNVGEQETRTASPAEEVTE
jgi:RNA polymerase sigma-70 factor (ECF subfamily)